MKLTKGKNKAMLAALLAFFMLPAIFFYLEKGDLPPAVFSLGGVFVLLLLLAVYLLLRETNRLELAEELLEQSEAKYRSVLENMPDALLIHDFQGRVLELNQNVARLLSGEGETLFEAVASLFNAAHNPSYSLARLLKDGFIAFETEYLRADGSRAILEIGSKVVSREGEGAVQSLIRDVTARKREEALRAAEERYRFLVENVNEAIVVAREGRNIFCNPAAARLFGRPQLELLATPFIEFIHPEDREEVLFRHARRMAGEVIEERYPFRLITGAGETRWIEAKVVVVPWEGERASLLVLSDITARREAEKKLAEGARELQRLYRQLDEEMDKARAVHERLFLRSFPPVPGLSFAAYYRPAQKMGGDMYDVIQAGDKLVLYLCDVSGHGLDGAMLSVFIKEAIASYVSLKPEALRPYSILQHLQRQFCRENYPEELYISIFLTVMDLEKKELCYCGAGFQETPLVRLGDGSAVKLMGRGFFLTNFLPEHIQTLQEEKIVLTPGSTVFFNTDGLTEQGACGAYYWERLPVVFYANAYLPPHFIVREVLDDFREFNGGSLQTRDDLTFLVLQLDPAEKRTHCFTLASDFNELKRLRQEALPFLEGLAESELFLTCLYELAANAIEHGNGFDPGRRVKVEIVRTETYLLGAVEDEGEGFNWREREERPLELEGGAERGRGIAMTRLCCAKLYYHEKGNRVEFVVINK